MNTLLELFFTLVSILILCVAMTIHPTHARCPDTWHGDGVRPSGEFHCLPTPIGDPDYDGTYLRPERSTQPPGELHGRIYCTGGSHAIVIDERTVGCQR